MNCSELREEMISYSKKNKLQSNVLYYFVVYDWKQITFCVEDDKTVLEEIISILSVEETENRVREALIQHGLSCSSVHYTLSFGKAKRFAIPFSFADMSDIENTASDCYFAYIIDV